MPPPSLLHCQRCRCTRPARLAPVAASLPWLGKSVECAACSLVLFSVIDGPYAFCPRCDTFTPIRMEASVIAGTFFACCGACAQTLAALNGELPVRLSGASESRWIASGGWRLDKPE